jgi:hypothetical protein
VAHCIQRPKAFHDVLKSDVHNETVLGKAPIQSDKGFPQ